MEVRKFEDMKPYVLLKPDDGFKYLPCSWVWQCFFGELGVLECHKCPADKCNDPMTHEEVTEFFEKHNPEVEYELQQME